MTSWRRSTRRPATWRNDSVGASCDGTVAPRAGNTTRSTLALASSWIGAARVYRALAEASLVLMVAGSVGITIGLDAGLLPQSSEGGLWRVGSLLILLVGYFLNEVVADHQTHIIRPRPTSQLAASAFFLALIATVPYLCLVFFEAFIDSRGIETNIAVTTLVYTVAASFVVLRVCAHYFWHHVPNPQARKAQSPAVLTRSTNASDDPPGQLLTA